MKTIGLEHATLEACIDEAQRDRIVIARDGRPVAVMVGVDGLDEEQLDYGSRDDFWRLVTQRRQEKTITRADLEKRLQ